MWSGALQTRHVGRKHWHEGEGEGEGGKHVAQPATKHWQAITPRGEKPPKKHVLCACALCVCSVLCLCLRLQLSRFGKKALHHSACDLCPLSFLTLRAAAVHVTQLSNMDSSNEATQALNLACLAQLEYLHRIAQLEYLHRTHATCSPVPCRLHSATVGATASALPQHAKKAHSF